MTLTLRTTTAIALALAATHAAAQDFTLTYASPYTETHPYGQADAEWIARIEEQTNGRVEITPYWGGTLVTSREGVDELAAGVADMAYIAPIYARSGYDMNRLVPGMFYGYTDPAEVLEVYTGLVEEYPQFTEELQGVHVLGYNVGTPMHLLLREAPVETLDDLQGLRIRSAVDFIGPLATFGAEGVTMPMTETFPALERGVVDGVIAPYEALKSLSFGDVVGYYSGLPHSRGAYPSRAMNQSVWDSLPQDIQAVFDDNVDWLSQRTMELSQVAEDAGREYGEEQGVVFNEIAPEVQAEYAASFEPSIREVAAELDAMGKPGTEVLEAVRAAHDE
ncbi:TRAP transporter substrate-binding protein [Wenxinia marina]|uniref:TRAP-type C4-dicarboxylate transport system, periplasmic component n=1 Tax=Wenxinia marina DSM 24838 TaxID=1123501 RepID=A0A0D0Q5R8_9RHOB|nr:TRAP transporter substrate-binding protein DctP [Wenxinia marina]KIQ69819.1 TRAP-type C4-dicarboxylate transport system, periplasmic component [Wenxinia marina DSM 24838]GGL61496.1 C4-dicarboxylate ABC transporter substrate-binding protein [Wenxinia marina]